MATKKVNTKKKKSTTVLRLSDIDIIAEEVTDVIKNIQTETEKSDISEQQKIMIQKYCTTQKRQDKYIEDTNAKIHNLHNALSKYIDKIVAPNIRATCNRITKLEQIMHYTSGIEPMRRPPRKKKMTIGLALLHEKNKKQKQKKLKEPVVEQKKSAEIPATPQKLKKKNKVTLTKPPDAPKKPTVRKRVIQTQESPVPKKKQKKISPTKKTNK